MTPKKRWGKLTDEQMQGANYALRVIHTSPVFRGECLEIVKELLQETYLEMGKRNSKYRKKARGSSA
jgi:hypothetical protein